MQTDGSWLVGHLLLGRVMVAGMLQVKNYYSISIYLPVNSDVKEFTAISMYSVLMIYVAINVMIHRIITLST